MTSGGCGSAAGGNTTIQHGVEAGLSSCRVQGEQAAALAQILSGKEVILLGPVSVTARLFQSADTDNDNSNDDTVDPMTVAVLGQCVVTTEQLLFWGYGNGGVEERETTAKHDFRVGAESIDLHALASDDTTDAAVAVYVQLSGDDDNSGNDCNNNSNHNSLWELMLTPTHTGVCQGIFDAITKLVSLHPIDPGDMDEPSNGAVGWFGEGPVMTCVTAALEDENGSDDDDGADDLVCAATITQADSPGTAEDERAAMLERLDNLLIVPPEYEVDEGQFEDADDDDDFL